jgi:hypothetical protein
MIGRGTYLDDALHLKLGAYARDGAQLRAQRGIRLDPEVIDFLRVADEISAARTAAYVSGLRKSAPAVAESRPEVDQLPAEITASQAAELLGCTTHGARYLAHKHGWVTGRRGKLIMISRDAVVAYKLRRDDERKAA